MQYIELLHVEIELSRVTPIIVGYPCREQMIVPIQWIIDNFVIEKIRINIARYSSWIKPIFIETIYIVAIA